MSNKLMLSVMAVLVAALLLLAGALPAAPAKAEALLQDVPRLDNFKIYFAESNGEPTRFDRSDNGFSRFAGLLWDLGATLESLDWRAGIPDDADLVIIGGSTSDIGADQIARLWSYLEADASLLLMVDPTFPAGRRVGGVTAGSGLFALTWSDMGFRIRDDRIVTELPSTIGTTLLDDVFNAAGISSSDPITSGITDGIRMFGARSIEMDATTTDFQLTPLTLSPGNYYGETQYPAYLTTGEARYNFGEDTPRGPLTTVLTAENTETNTRIALVGDSDMARNGRGFITSPEGSGGFLYPDNVIFMLRLVSWLLNADPNNVKELNFPTPGPTATPTLTPTPLIIVADLDVTISTNTVIPREGDAFVYTITVTNLGPEPAFNVIVEIDLPLEVTFLASSSAANRPFNPEEGVWSLETMQVQESATLDLVVTVNQGTAGRSVINTAHVTSLDLLTDPESGNDLASAEVTVQVREG